MNTINYLLKKGSEELDRSGIEKANLEAKIFLCEALKKEDYYIYAHPEEKVEEAECEKYFSFINRRKKREPVAYITGKKEFMGLEFYVNKNVLIPRGDTEILVQEALKLLRPGDEVLEIGAGSGCVSISLIKSNKDVKIKGIDISEKALDTARKNAVLHGVEREAEFIKSDLFENVMGRFDVIISNPPYISAQEYETLDLDIIKYEPKIALVGGEDGLYFYERIIREGKAYLKEKGSFVFEIGYTQAEDVSLMLKNSGFDNIDVIKDYAGLDRVIIARRSLRK